MKPAECHRWGVEVRQPGWLPSLQGASSERFSRDVCAGTNSLQLFHVRLMRIHGSRHIRSNNCGPVHVITRLSHGFTTMLHGAAASPRPLEHFFKSVLPFSKTSAQTVCGCEYSHTRTCATAQQTRYRCHHRLLEHVIRNQSTITQSSVAGGACLDYLVIAPSCDFATMHLTGYMRSACCTTNHRAFHISKAQRFAYVCRCVCMPQRIHFVTHL